MYPCQDLVHLLVNKIDGVTRCPVLLLHHPTNPTVDDRLPHRHSLQIMVKKKQNLLDLAGGRLMQMGSVWVRFQVDKARVNGNYRVTVRSHVIVDSLQPLIPLKFRPNLCRRKL